MATDVEVLIVRLEAQATKFERAMARAAGVADQRGKEIEKSLGSSVANALSRIDRDAGAINKVLLGVGASLSAAQIGKFADEWLSASNKIRAAGLGKEQADAARDRIAVIAATARTDFSETAALFARLTRSTQQFGASQDDVARATEVVAKSVKLSGASAQEAEATFQQLSQALQSGALQGDELRSLLENAPVLAQAIAKEFGVAIGELKNLGSEGKLTSDRVFKALLSAGKEVDAAFKNFAPTIADSFKALQVAAIQFVGTSGQVNGVVALITRSVLGLANNFNAVATGATALAVVMASRLLASGLTPLISALAATSAGSIGAASALAGLGTAASAAAVGSRLLAVALGFLGGPVGAAIFGLVTAFGYLSARSQDGAATATAYATALQQVEAAAAAARPSVKGLAEEVQKAEQSMNDLARAKAEVALRQAEKTAQDLRTGISGLVDDLNRYGAVNLREADKRAAIELVTRAMTGSKEEADAARIELQRMGDANPSFANAISSISVLLKELAVVRQSAEITRQSIASIGDAANKAAEKRIAAAIPNPTAASTFDQDAAGINADPVVRALRGQGVTSRAVIEAEYSKTQKEFNDKRKELVKSILDGGGAVPDDIDAITRRVLAGEEARSGGGGGGSKSEKKNDYEKEIEQIDRKIEALGREAATYGKGTFEIERAKAALELEQAAKKAGIPITDELRAAIDSQSAAYANAKVKVEDVKQAHDGLIEAQRFAGQQLSSFFSDIVSGGKNAQEAVMNLTKRLADAALQALLLGDGPLAKVFGTAGKNGATGGLFGALFGGLFGGFREAGGPVSPGRAYIVGEKRPEIFVPKAPGMIVSRIPQPVRQSGGGGISIQQTMTFQGQQDPAMLFAFGQRIKAETLAAVQAQRATRPGYLQQGA